VNFLAHKTWVCVACKCGFTSVKSVLRPPGKDITPDHVDRIVAIVRDPAERLLSAWRMYYPGCVISLHKHGSRNDPNRIKTDWQYIEQHGQDIIDNPLRHFHNFLYHHLHRFQNDHHFAPQWLEYRKYVILYPHKIQLLPQRDLNSLFLQVGAKPVHENRGGWPFKHVEPQQFLKLVPGYDSPVMKPYIEDHWLWQRAQDK